MSRAFKKKDDGSWLFLPGIGRVHSGRVYVGEKYARFCPPLVEVSLDGEEAAAPAPVSAPEPTEEPKRVFSGIEGYDDLNVADAVDAISGLEFVEDIEFMLKYEKAHKNRKGVVSEIEELLSEQ